MTSSLPELDGVTHRDVRVGGVRLHVAEAGSGSPVVLLHGWPQHWWAWRKVLPELAKQRRVICPDLRGFGWSDAPAGPYELGELAADVVGLLDALELDRVELVGHDWGGYIGFLVCLRAPERIRHYLAMAIAHPWVEPPKPSLGALRTFGYQFLLAAPGVGASTLRFAPSFVELVFKKGSHPEMTWTEEELACYAQSFRPADHALASSHLYRSFLRREVPRLRNGHYRSRRLSVPTRLLTGEADLVVQAQALDGFQDYADDMSLEVVERSGHFIAEERPELVLERAAELFDPVSAG
ncbi:MAG TPA: alpha/beta hydrolase [Solirubrobacterales bacterium]